MIRATTTSGITDLKQILELQQQNLTPNLTKDEIQSQGFVTINHSLEMLQQMHEMSPSVIIKDGDTIVAYALTMLVEFSRLVPGLESMFERFSSLQWNGRPLNDYSYYVMGQICVHKDYRGKGLFDLLYQKHRDFFSNRFDLIVTEIATRNTRSLRAHERVGFKTINVHTDALDEWKIVAWDFT